MAAHAAIGHDNNEGRGTTRGAPPRSLHTTQRTPVPPIPQ